MTRRITVAASAFLLVGTGCQKIADEVHRAQAERAPVPTVQEDQAKWAHDVQQAVLAKLRDPDSAKWGAVWTPDGVASCGWVNAKNGFGGYTGPVLYTGYGRGDAAIDGGALSEFDRNRLKACRSAPRVVIVPGDPGPPGV